MHLWGTLFLSSTLIKKVADGWQRVGRNSAFYFIHLSLEVLLKVTGTRNGGLIIFKVIKVSTGIA